MKPLDFSPSWSVSTVLVSDLSEKKWGSYQGEKPIVHSKNIIAEPSWGEVAVHSPPFSLTVVAQKKLHVTNTACVIII